MRYYDINSKQLPIPSFFQVYNFGGGNGDKDREIVYAELTSDTPALLNYYYICNRYPHVFQSRLFDDISQYETVGDLYNFIREKLIEKGEVYSGYTQEPFDFNSKIFLLDSGAFSIVKAIASSVDYSIEKFVEELPAHARSYYDFADRLKFDIVVGFDMGGKYTQKDGENRNVNLNNFLGSLDYDAINDLLLEEAAAYLSNHQDYYPRMLATVHGNTMEEYASCVYRILELEQKYGVYFWGFALGGIASYKQVDDSWYDDISFAGFGKRGFIDAVTPARACKLVHEIVGDRPIHALGCGGYNNIALNYYAGATSFDAASPVRRVGDGNAASARIVFDPTPSAESFSKYFVGGINMDGTDRFPKASYVKLNEVDNNMQMCGCPACEKAGSIYHIKELYASKENDSEANYYSRQLMGLHAVWQHRKLCETVAQYPSMQEFYLNHPSELNDGLIRIYEQIKN